MSYGDGDSQYTTIFSRYVESFLPQEFSPVFLDEDMN